MWPFDKNNVFLETMWPFRPRRPVTLLLFHNYQNPFLARSVFLPFFFSLLGGGGVEAPTESFLSFLSLHGKFQLLLLLYISDLVFCTLGFTFYIPLPFYPFIDLFFILVSALDT
jgi:hypothetical protein